MLFKVTLPHLYIRAALLSDAAKAEYLARLDSEPDPVAWALEAGCCSGCGLPSPYHAYTCWEVVPVARYSHMPKQGKKGY